jgi:hypothetical protein
MKWADIFSFPPGKQGISQYIEPCISSSQHQRISLLSWESGKCD